MTAAAELSRSISARVRRPRWHLCPSSVMLPLEVPHSLLSGSDYFALRVYGESMIAAGIQDGDLVVIRKASHASVGQIVVAIDDEGQTTLKRLAHDGERYYLHPENPEFADIYPEELRIQGVAELMLRDLKQ